MTDPWTTATPGTEQDVTPLCQHICATLNVDDGIEVAGCTPHHPPALTSSGVSHVLIHLKKTRIFTYTIKIQEADSGERVLKAKTVLAQLIMSDPLLLAGVTEFDYECTSNDWTGSIVFHGHKVDISPFFDGQILQTSSIVNEIIRNVSASSGQEHVCNISMVPIRTSIAFLECESSSTQQRFYEEANIRKWVLEHGTSPFTRLLVTVSDINTIGPVGDLATAPRLVSTRKSSDMSSVPKKKARVSVKKNITCVWDCSGSMRSMYSESKQGLRKTIEEQRALAISTGNPTTLTVITFDHEIKYRIDSKDIVSVDLADIDDWVRPRGMTRLYDAIVSAASRCSESTHDSGILIVMTDGYDTNSEASPDVVRETLEKLKTEKDTECIFMAANIGNAEMVGPTMGFSSDTSITFTPGAAESAFDSLSQSALRSVTGGSARFTQIERECSVNCNVRSATVM